MLPLECGDEASKKVGFTITWSVMNQNHKSL